MINKNNCYNNNIIMKDKIKNINLKNKKQIIKIFMQLIMKKQLVLIIKNKNNQLNKNKKIMSIILIKLILLIIIQMEYFQRENPKYQMSQLKKFMISLGLIIQISFINCITNYKKF